MTGDLDLACSEESSGNGADDSEGGPHESLASFRRKVSVDLHAKVRVFVLVLQGILGQANVGSSINCNISAHGVRRSGNVVAFAVASGISEEGSDGDFDL